MKCYYLAILVCALFSCKLMAQVNNQRVKINKTANYTSKTNWNDGLFQSLQHGMSNRMVQKNNTVFITFLPSVGRQIRLEHFNDLILSTENDERLNSHFRTKISPKEVTGFMLSEYDLPFVISLNNYLMMNRLMGSNYVVPLDPQLSFAVNKHKQDLSPSIDVPLIYSPEDHYFMGISTKSGLSMKGIINKRLSYEQTGRILFFTRNIDNFFLENSGTFMWNVQESLRIKAGYVFSWGKYPYGDYLQFWPTLDIVLVDLR